MTACRGHPASGLAADPVAGTERGPAGPPARGDRSAGDDRPDPSVHPRSGGPGNRSAAGSRGEADSPSADGHPERAEGRGARVGRAGGRRPLICLDRAGGRQPLVCLDRTSDRRSVAGRPAGRAGRAGLPGRNGRPSTVGPAAGRRCAARHGPVVGPGPVADLGRAVGAASTDDARVGDPVRDGRHPPAAVAIRHGWSEAVRQTTLPRPDGRDRRHVPADHGLHPGSRAATDLDGHHASERASRRAACRSTYGRRAVGESAAYGRRAAGESASGRRWCRQRGQQSTWPRAWTSTPWSLPLRSSPTWPLSVEAWPPTWALSPQTRAPAWPWTHPAWSPSMSP